MNKFTYGLLAASALCTAGFVATALPAAARHGDDANFSISLGNAQFGYSDGYYDNDRRWHNWQDDDERDWYRENHGQTYYQMTRDRDPDRYRRDWRDGRRNDWRGDGYSNFSIVLGNVVFGYSDGYYDNRRRWHRWRSNSERNWYRQNHGQTYYQMSRYRDRDRFRRDWRDGRRNDWRDSRYDGDSPLE